MTTLLRRKLAAAAGLLCVAAPVLSSCGFDYATDRPNVIAHGGFHMAQDGMRILATRIVASDSHHGIFVATIALNPTANAATAVATAPTLTGLSTRGDSKYQLTAKKFSPIAVGDSGAVNLADPSVGGIQVSGDFAAGASIPVTLTFSDGKAVSVQTPVVTQCGEFASVAPQAGASTPAKAGKGAKASATASPSVGETTGATGEVTPGPSDAAPAQTSAASAPYDCSFPELPRTTE